MLVDFKASTFLLQPEHRYLFSPESLSALTYYLNECYRVTYSVVFGLLFTVNHHKWALVLSRLYTIYMYNVYNVYIYIYI